MYIYTYIQCVPSQLNLLNRFLGAFKTFKIQEVVSYISHFAHKEGKFDNITMFIRFLTREES